MEPIYYIAAWALGSRRLCINGWLTWCWWSARRWSCSPLPGCPRLACGPARSNDTSLIASASVTVPTALAQGRHAWQVAAVNPAGVATVARGDVLKAKVRLSQSQLDVISTRNAVVVE